MFNLETEIVRWRHKMAEAGIRPGKILDELESHLRDDISQALTDGTAPEAAFASAVAKLGPAPALKREFDSADSGTIGSMLRRPVPVFPRNMRGMAFAALYFGPALMISAINNFALNWVLFVPRPPAKPLFPLEFVLFLTVLFLFGVLGLASAIGYLWKPVHRFARPLAVFWVFVGWSLCSLFLHVVLGTKLVLNHPFGAVSIISYVAAVIVYYGWDRALRDRSAELGESKVPEWQ